MAEFSFNAVWSVWEKVPVLLLYVACKPLYSPTFSVESDFGNHPSYLEVIHAPTGCLVTQVTGMNHSFSLSKLTP